MRIYTESFLYLALLSLAAGAYATPPTKHEWSFGSGIGIYFDGIDYRTHFTPYESGEKSASQKIRFTGEELPVLSVAYTRWITPQWGISALGRHAQTTWKGNNEPISIQFTYNAWQSMQPYPQREYNEIVESPRHASGSWSSYQFALGLKRRFQWGRMESSLQGYLVHDRSYAFTLNNLYFENRMMISRGVLVPSSLFMQIGPNERMFSRTGASVCLNASTPLGSKLRGFVDARFLWLPSSDLRMSLTGFEPINLFSNADTHEQVADLSAFDQFKTPEMTLSLEAGLQFRF